MEGVSMVLQVQGVSMALQVEGVSVDACSEGQWSTNGRSVYSITSAGGVYGVTSARGAYACVFGRPCYRPVVYKSRLATFFSRALWASCDTLQILEAESLSFSFRRGTVARLVGCDKVEW
jgi:hypothetical protein